MRTFGNTKALRCLLSCLSVVSVSVSRRGMVLELFSR